MLKGLNLHIKPNETVALVGESGCGKSTTVQLILRFYDVNEGRILIDGVDVRDWDLISLRKAMGLVMQEPTLFNYSVAENILYGEMNATNSAIRDATQVANAIEFIETNNADLEYEESPEVLYNEFRDQGPLLIQSMGEKAYNE